MIRHAIYFLPDPASALWAFGCSVLGYDSMSGVDVETPNHPVLRAGGTEISAEPRRYGFHATLKAPFALRAGLTEDDLAAAVESFATGRRPFTIPRLGVARLGSFLALVPAEPSGELGALAGACVEAFEPYRAPLAPAARSRRLKAPLTPRQVELLDAWGYPYVLDEFRFHMTLTGHIESPRREQIDEALRDLYAALDGPVDVDAVTLLRQADENCRFVAVRRFLLAA